MKKKEKPSCMQLVSFGAEVCSCRDADYGDSNLEEEDKRHGRLN